MLKLLGNLVTWTFFLESEQWAELKSFECFINFWKFNNFCWRLGVYGFIFYINGIVLWDFVSCAQTVNNKHFYTVASIRKHLPTYMRIDVFAMALLPVWLWFLCTGISGHKPENVFHTLHILQPCVTFLFPELKFVFVGEGIWYQCDRRKNHKTAHVKIKTQDLHRCFQ